jgi:phytoene desaturase
MTSLATGSRNRSASSTTDSAERAVVIGAGFGGIASALRLRAQGFDVTLIDRCPRLGGRAQVFERDGYRHDAGPTVLTAHFLFDELFELFGKKREDYVEFRPLDLWYRFDYADGSTFDYGGTVEQTLAEIRKIHPPDADGYLRMVEDSKRIFAKGFTELSDRPFDRFGTMMRCLPDLLRLRCWRTVWQMVRGHLKHEKLQRAFSIQPLLVGGNPLDTTCIYSLIHYLEREWGVHFPMGGTGALVDALGRLLDEVGVDVRLGVTVDKILTHARASDGRLYATRGVRLEDGEELLANTVVANADPPHVYQRMLPDVEARVRWTPKRVDNMRYSMGLFVLYFGTNRRYEDIAHHTIVLGEGYEDPLKSIFKGPNLDYDLNLYLHRPTATDPSFAPEGHDSYYVLSPVPNLKSGTIDWAKEGKGYADRVIAELEKRLMPGLRESIRADFFMTPDDFRTRYFAEYGAGFSIQPVFTQSAWFRFHNRSEEVDGLYFAGAGTHPGAGMPGVLSSAKVVERLVKARHEA